MYTTQTYTCTQAHTHTYTQTYTAHTHTHTHTYTYTHIHKHTKYVHSPFGRISTCITFCNILISEQRSKRAIVLLRKNSSTYKMEPGMLS